MPWRPLSLFICVALASMRRIIGSELNFYARATPLIHGLGQCFKRYA